MTSVDSGLSTAIDNQIETAYDYANAAISDATAAMDALNEAIKDAETDFDDGYFLVNTPTIEPIGAPQQQLTPWQETLATVAAFIDQGIEFPNEPPMRPLPPIADPTFDVPGDAPVLSFPPQPDDFDGVVPTVPSIDDLELPDEPTFTEYDPPDFNDVVVPEPPEFSDLPTFDAVVPTPIAAPEVPPFNYIEPAYESELHDAAEAWLLNIIANGGTGLTAEVEAGIFDRALTRETVTARRNIENAIDEFATSGFPRPSGALRARIDTVRSELQNRTDDFSRKVAEDQAKLAQANIHFTISESIKLEAIDVQRFNAMADRMLKAAGMMVELAVTAYNLYVMEYTARIEGFKAEVDVFLTLVRAAGLEVDYYKARLSVTGMEIDINTSLANQYAAALQGQKVLADVYATRVSVVKVLADIESLKIDIFRGEIELYQSEIRAKELEYDAFKAGISAEETKVTVFKVEIDALISANDAKRQQIDASKARLLGIVESNKADLSVYETKLGAQIELIKQNSAAISAAGVAQQGIASGYVAEVGFQKAQADVNIAGAQVALSASEINARAMSAYHTQLSMLREKIQEVLIKASASAAEIQTGRASAALSQINTVSQLIGNGANQ